MDFEKVCECTYAMSISLRQITLRPNAYYVFWRGIYVSSIWYGCWKKKLFSIAGLLNMNELLTHVFFDKTGIRN